MTTSTITSTVPPASTSTVPQVSTSTAPTAAQAVDTALNHLSLSHVQNLWNEKVANVSFFSKIPGLISYLWNKSTAVESDRANGATIELFNSKVAELVNALKSRGLTNAEATKAGVAPVKYNNLAQQQVDAEHKLNADKLEKEFYDVFKTRCAQLTVGGDDLKTFAAGAFKALNNHANTIETTQKNSLIAKLGSAEFNFNGKICNDMIQDFASKPVATITPDSFKAKVAELVAFFPNNSIANVEASIRKAIKANPANVVEMSTISNAFINAAPNNPKVAELKATLKVELDAAMVDIQAKMLELRGPSTANGTIHTAYDAMVAAEVAANAAEVTLQTALNALGGPGATRSALLALPIANGAVASPAVQTAHADLVAKDAAFVAAKAEHDRLTAELATLAVWTGGNISGGTFREVNDKLNALDATARTEATKLGRFFFEINKSFADGEEAARSTALHTIIG